MAGLSCVPPRRTGGRAAVLAMSIVGVVMWGPTSVSSQAVGTVPYTRRSDVIYGHKSGLALTMEVFVPGDPNGLGVVWVVSSSGVSSRDQTLQPGFDRRIMPFLEHRYTVFAVIHGSAPRFQIEDFVSDVTRAVKFVRYHAGQFGIDGERLAIAGASAGGYLALMVALNGRDGDKGADDAVERMPGRVAVAGCFFPPSDLIDYGGSGEDIVAFLHRKYGVVDPSFRFFTTDSTGIPELVVDPAEVARRLSSMSPITHVSADDPPVMVIHGDRDEAVPVQQSERLVERLRHAGVLAHLIVRTGKGHTWQGWEADGEAIADWFDSQLLSSRRGPHKDDVRDEPHGGGREPRR